MILRNVLVSQISAFVVIAIVCAVWALDAAAQNPESRVVQKVVESQRVTLAGHVHPLAKAKYDQGAVEDSAPAGRILMLLSRTEAQQAALDKLLEEQQTPGSANFHRWLTPDEFGSKFGASDADVQKVTEWLVSKGFVIEKVAPSKLLIEFSGTAGQVKNAFSTELHRYAVPSGTYTANIADPQIPAALAPVVSGFVSLNNFPRHSYARVHGTAVRNATGVIRPEWTSSTGGFFAIGPGDFAVIYNSMPLIQSNINGAGQTIGIVGQSNISLTDVANFRSLFGLPTSTPTVVVDGTDPGLVTSGDEGESVMDVEWAGATAPGATIKLVIAKTTSTTSGVDLAAQYLVNNNLADILSESYGACEPELLTSGNTFYKNLWQQAAGQGITVVVASGDAGSAGCEDPNSAHFSEASLGGAAVSGIASTPYNVAVGGTDFNDASSTATYWGTNYTDSISGEKHISALGYIPEMTWNDSCAHSATASSLTTCASATVTNPDSYGSLQLWASGGGPSNCATGSGTTCSGYSKPSWQKAPGVPSDGVRDTPDVSLFAATGDSGSNSFYVACQADASGSCVASSGGSVPFLGVSGTSAATPNFAAIVALVEQQIGNQRLGNINYLLYKIAANGASCPSSSPTNSCVFYDNQAGNISVPCAAGSPNCSLASGTTKSVLVANGAPAYMTTTGYDTATGLGSVNVNNLVAAIANMAVPTISTPSATSTALGVGSSTTLSVTVTGNSSLGAPTGTITFRDGTASLGAATSTSTSGNTVTGSRSYSPTASGTHTITATVSAGGGYVGATSSALTVTVNAAFTQSLASTAINLGSSGGSGTNSITFTPASSGGASITISYYCSSSSTAASCSPTSSAPGSVSISNAPVAANIAYTVPALGASAKPAQHTTPWKLGGGVLFAGVILLAVPKVRRRGQFALMLLLVGAVAISASCGGGGANRSTLSTSSPQQFTFTVTASATANGETTTQTSTFTVTN